MKIDWPATRPYLIGAIWALILIPLLTYWRTGQVGPLGWGLAVFLVVICLLQGAAAGMAADPANRTPVAPRNDWLDRLGSFWLLACSFGPLAGWIVTQVIPITLPAWRWAYGLRVVLAIILPLVTMLPLLRYPRGRILEVGLLILLTVTQLSVVTALPHAADLLVGPLRQTVTVDADGCRVMLVRRLDAADCAAVAQSRSGRVEIWWLPVTNQSLGVVE